MYNAVEFSYTELCDWVPGPIVNVESPCPAAASSYTAVSSCHVLALAPTFNWIDPKLLNTYNFNWKQNLKFLVFKAFWWLKLEENHLYRQLVEVGGKSESIVWVGWCGVCDRKYNIGWTVSIASLARGWY